MVRNVGSIDRVLRKVRKGSSEPGYERVVMKMLGVNKLKAS